MELKQKTQRGSLLSSIVMVMLATVATGMLAFIGFQALPDSVIPATFGGDDRSSRHVNVSDSPAPPEQANRPTAVPSTKPPVPVETANPQATARPTRDPKPTRQGSATQPTAKPKPSTTTTTGPKPAPTTTTAPPKVSPSPSQSTQTASPAPTCGTGRKPRCPRSAEPASTPTREASYGDGSSSYAPTKSSTDAQQAETKSGKPAKADRPTKPAKARR